MRVDLAKTDALRLRMVAAFFLSWICVEMVRARKFMAVEALLLFKEELEERNEGKYGTLKANLGVVAFYRQR